MNSYYLLLHIFILVFCIFESASLFETWMVSPFDAYSWVVFAIWLLPLYAIRIPHTWMLSECALLLVILGILTEVNTVTYLGLAFSVAAWVPWTKASFLWIFSAICWMPIISYLAVEFPFSLTVISKILTVALCSILKVRSLQNANQR